MDEQRLSAVLVEFAHTLTTDFSLQGTLDHLVERVVEVLPVTGAGVLLMDNEGRDHHFVAATDDVIRRIETLQLELGEGPCLQAYRTGQAVLLPDLLAEERFPRFSPRAVQAGLSAVFAFPLRLDDERMGALELYTSWPAELSEADHSAAQTLADVMTAYLFNARMRMAAEQAASTFKRQALHDALTGLPNRVLLHDRLGQALDMARRSDGFVGVLFCDIDDLKSVNDTHGHRVGDEVLSTVARRIERAVRPGDTLARLSGDEFVVLCQNLSAPRQGREIAERILATLFSPIEVYGLRLEARLSIGINVVRAAQATVEGTLHQADRAMYAAKGKGGGCCFVV